MSLCSEIISSEEYADFIIEFGGKAEDILRQYEAYCVQVLEFGYACAYVKLSEIPEVSVNNFTYYSIPKLYGLMDTTAVEAAGALRLQGIRGLNLTGKGVIIGFIDTGISYINNAFRTPTGQTRILRIWDQTDNNGNSPEHFEYGSEYTREDIDRALRSDNPYDVVPTRDTNGHGTFLAGVAAGSRDVENDFIGAAPESEIAIVKLKPAKQYLRDYFLIERKDGAQVAGESTDAYQENDIMLAVSYLRELSVKEEKPLVLMLGVGTGSGDHSGGSVLGQMLDRLGQIMGNCCVVASGNEGNARLHYHGVLQSTGIRENATLQATDDLERYKDVEIKVADNDNGFVIELWGDTPDLYSVAFISPSGESVPRIPARIGLNDKIGFVLERTEIEIAYRIVESGSGGELIFMRFINPAPGIWTMRVYGTNLLKGDFHIWFNVKQFVNPETYFLNPDPDVTLTVPSSVTNVITVGAYDNKTGGLYVNTGRGFSRTGEIKPDFVAPGVNVYGPSATGYTRKTGTSVAAALVAGNCAQLMQWGIVDGNDIKMRTVFIKSYLIRGANRDRNIVYPNTQWGYGKVDVYSAFVIISRT